MKLEKIVSFYFIFFFGYIKASYAKLKLIDDENAIHLKRNLQIPGTESINTSKIYNITITNFSVNKNDLYFIISSNPSIENRQDNITFLIYFQINRYDKSDGSWYYKNYSCYILDYYNPGMYATSLDFNITDLTIINIYDAVKEYKLNNNIYYINYPNQYLIIDPPKAPYLSNETLKGKYDYYINITDFYIENNQFHLLIDFNPNAPEDITLLSPLLIEVYDKSSGNMTERIHMLELKIYNTTNIPNKFSLDFNSFNISGYSEISMLYAVVENNTNDYMIKVDFPLLKKIIFYEINITDYYFNGNELVFIIDYWPKIAENISLLLRFTYYSYNESIGYSFYTYINETININNNSNIYSINFITFNVVWSMEIRILSAFIENKTKESYFFIYHPDKTLVYNTSSVIHTEMPTNIYYINISDFYSNNTGIIFNIFFETYTSDNIELIITLNVYSYNNTAGNYIYQYINVTLILDYYNNQYYSILSNVNLTYYFEISIIRAFISTNSYINIYNTYYPKKTLYYYAVITSTSILVEPINTPTNEPANNPNNRSNDNNNNENDDNNNGVNRENDDNTNNDNNDDGDTETTPSTVTTKKSSNSLSIGAIIGIIVGGLTVIGIIAGVIIFIRKRRKKIKEEKDKLVKGIPNFESDDKIITTSGNINLNVPEQNMRKFHFETQSQFKIDFSIEANKDLKDLRKLYFEKINRNDLLNDNSIYFLRGGNLLKFEGLVNDKFGDYRELYKIVVVDNEEKIYKMKIN